MAETMPDELACKKEGELIKLRERVRSLVSNMARSDETVARTREINLRLERERDELAYLLREWREILKDYLVPSALVDRTDRALLQARAGIPIVVNPSLPAGTFELRTRDQTVRGKIEP